MQFWFWEHMWLEKLMQNVKIFASSALMRYCLLTLYLKSFGQKFKSGPVKLVFP